MYLQNQDDQQMKAAVAANRPIVAAIGASAGGIEALRTFFPALPADLDVAFVVIIHLSPEHPSELAPLLAPCTTLPVTQVTSTVMLAPKQIYLIPPNRELIVSDGLLRVTPFTESPGQRTPIDAFFLSLAATYGDGFGIILSGNGTDGTVGLKAIKERGGLVLVQTPTEAAFASMPQSAIDTGLADLVLPVGKLAARMADLTQTKQQLQVDPDQLSAPDVTALTEVLQYLQEQTGHDFSGYKRATVLRRVGRRMQLSQHADYAAYHAYLRATPTEVPALFNDLLIAVTTFFRDPAACAALAEQVIPRILADTEVREQLRVWVPGCASGEEAYTIAILLLEQLETLAKPPTLQIFASDLDEHALAIARAGRYPDAIAGDVSPERLQRFFVRDGNYYQLKPVVRESLIFSPHNLLRDPPFARIDLIACRNLLPYLGDALQQQLLYTFNYALWRKQGGAGYLFLGAEESNNLRTRSLFQPLDGAHGIFQSLQRASQRLPLLSDLLYGWQQPQINPVVHKSLARPDRAVQRHRLALEAVAPPSILVDGALQPIHLSENAGYFLQLPSGAFITDITRLVRPELQETLADALQAALHEGQSTFTAPIVVNFDGSNRQVNLLVRPVQPSDAQSMQALVLFIDAGPPTQTPSTAGIDRAHNKPVSRSDQADHQQLVAELHQTRAELQASRTEYAASMEQLYSTNEELQTINEEYSSITEELQTSREELQSLNEELQTVNDELMLKLREISQAHSDLQNLMDAAEVGTLFLDRGLHIRRYTPPVMQIFQIKAEDLGRPITDLAHRLNYTGLVADARNVMHARRPIEREILNEDGTWYLLRLRPYRTVNNQIDGAVVTFIDITRHKKAEGALRQLNETLEERVVERTAQVRALASTLTMAEQEERRRIAQILHDQLQQQLYGIQMRVMTMRLDIEAREFTMLSEQTQEVYRWISEAIRATRHLTIDLSPPVLKDEGLVDALHWLATQMTEINGLVVTLQAAHAFPIANEDMRVLLFQIVRELLFNVVKHANTQQATVTLREYSHNEIMITVSDGGCGFDPTIAQAAHNGGFGLFSIRERLDLFGGKMAIDSAPGQGTQVILHAPIADLPLRDHAKRVMA